MRRAHTLTRDGRPVMHLCLPATGCTSWYTRADAALIHYQRLVLEQAMHPHHWSALRSLCCWLDPNGDYDGLQTWPTHQVALLCNMMLDSDDC